MKLKTKLLLAVATMSLAVSHQARGDDGAGALTGRYWFDQSTTVHPFTPGHLEISTSDLPEGLHSLSAYVRDANGTTSSVMSRWFVKTMGILPGLTYKTVVFVDGKTFQTIENQAAGYGTLSFSLDMNALPLGIHSLQVQVVSPNGIVSDMKETMFIRVPSSAQLATMKGYYTLDGKIAGELATSVNGDLYHLDIDASALTSGLHSISVYLASPIGLITSMRTGWFVKIPAGGEGIKSYEYWINDNPEHTQVTLDKVANPMQLVSLMDVPEQPFRTSSYTFAVEDGEPVVYPLNDFHVLFLDPDARVTEGSASYADVRGRRVVDETEMIEDPINIFTETISDGDIKWYSFEGEMGDSVATRLSGAGMFELYGPDGSKLLARSGADATAISTTTLSANGTHYLAVHDIAQINRKTDVVLDHIARFAICSFTPEKVGQTDNLVVNILGNGFVNLKEVCLAGKDGKIIPVNISKAGNNNIALYFNTEKPLAVGEYEIQCVFYDPDKGKDVEVVSSIPLVIEEAHPSEIKVEIVDSRIISTPYMSAVKVTNTGNVPYYCVPFNVAIPYPKDNGTIHFTGFHEIENNDSLSIFNLTENILETGARGAFINAMILYLGPGETQTYEVGFTTGPHEIITWYAWCGKPWSEEIKEMESEDYDLEQICTFSGRNYLCLRDYANALAHVLYDQPQNGPQKAPGDVANAALDVLNTRIEITPQQARDAANQAVQVGKQSVGFAAEQSSGLLSSRIEHHNMLREQNGYIYDMAGLGEADRINKGMLGVAELLMALGNTDDDFFGHMEALFYLLQARDRWHEVVNPNPDADGNMNGGGPTASNPTPHATDCYQSGDPNEMLGYTSPSGDNYVGLDVKTLDYAIEFENDPEIANASATRIKVANKLDAKLFDLSTFKAAKMIIGSKETDLPEGHHFVKTLDMRPEINSIAELTFDYDAAEGTASWSIRTLDPMTLEPTQYMDDGVLPVNDGTGRGIGFLTYTIGLRDGLADGTEIPNKAVITFDDNEPIETPVYKNVTDYTRPEARIVSRTTEDGLTHTFEIEGSDSGSGIWYYDLYMRRAGSNDWTLVKPQIEAETFDYTSPTATDGADWAIVAVDRAGNTQAATFLGALAGDADGNGAIDASDVVVIRNYYMDSSVQINKANADVNVDTTIDAQDAAITRNLYLGEDILKSQNKTRRRK